MQCNTLIEICVRVCICVNEARGLTKDTAVLMKGLEDARLAQGEGEDLLTMDELMLRAGEAMLMARVKASPTNMHQRQKYTNNASGIRVDDEHASAHDFMCKLREKSGGGACASQAALDILRDQCVAAGMRFRELRATDACNIAQECLAGQGKPVLLSRAALGDAWKRGLSIDSLRRRFGDDVVSVNDRAPARHADAEAGEAQTSFKVRMKTYVDYMAARRNMEAMRDPHYARSGGHHRPFYLNGWSLFSRCPELLTEFEAPACVAAADDTEALLAEIGGLVGGKARDETNAWASISANMQKIFIGCRGCVTRLHYDSGDAHGWLAQASGAKLFILFAPEDSQFLVPPRAEVLRTSRTMMTTGQERACANNEKEKRAASASPGVAVKDDTQAFVDPLRPPSSAATHTGHTYAKATMFAAVVQEGELIVIPRRWWHYALALEDDNLTLQRNFYNAATNAAGLVKMTLDAIRKRR